MHRCPAYAPLSTVCTVVHRMHRLHRMHRMHHLSQCPNASPNASPCPCTPPDTAFVTYMIVCPIHAFPACFSNMPNTLFTPTGAMERFENLASGTRFPVLIHSRTLVTWSNISLVRSILWYMSSTADQSSLDSSREHGGGIRNAHHSTPTYLTPHPPTLLISF